jgi:hypothetical protein
MLSCWPWPLLSAASPEESAGAYATGHYRDLFAEQLGAHAKIEAAFQ